MKKLLIVVCFAILASIPLSSCSSNSSEIDSLKLQLESLQKENQELKNQISKIDNDESESAPTSKLSETSKSSATIKPTTVNFTRIC